VTNEARIPTKAELLNALRSSAQEMLAAPRLGDFYFSLDSLRELAKEEEGGKDES